MKYGDRWWICRWVIVVWWFVRIVPMKFASLILRIFHGINLDGYDR